MKDYVALARQYETDVLSGSIPACKQVRQACQRNVNDLARQGARGFPYRFDEKIARRICEAAELLPHIKGPEAKVIGRDDEDWPIWNPIRLEPWQCWVLTSLFGWQQIGPEPARRRFKVALVLVPRKNAKSTLAAIVALYMLTADGESGAECYSAATTRDQAKVVAEIAWEMSRRSPEFTKHFGVKVGAKTTRVLEVPASASKFMPLSADAHTLDGLNVSFAAIDELHAHPTRGVWDVIDTATGARVNPLILAITTAGVDIGGICHEKMSYLHKVLEGTQEDDTFFGINYTVDDGDDWRLEATWKKANPNYGVSVSAEDLERKAREAQSSSAAVNNFLTKHLNVWVRSESTWLPTEAWIKNGDASRTIEQYAQHPCWIGVDLAEVRDIAAVVIVFRLAADQFVVFGRYYLPEATVAKSQVAQMTGFVRGGFLIQTDGDQSDYQRIEDDIAVLCKSYRVEKVCFDRALAAQMTQSLQRRLGGKPPLETVPQGAEVMTPAMQTVERLILSGGMLHDANPCMTWMMSNVVVKPSHRGEIYPIKAGGKDSPNKIDGPVALFTAMSQAFKEIAKPQMFFLGAAR